MSPQSSSGPQRSARVAFLALESYPFETPTDYMASFSYAVRKLEASLRADPSVGECETTVIDLHTSDIDEFFEAVRAYKPTLVAMSVYIWSVAPFLRLAKRIKEHDPSIAIVMGGPSARPSVLALPPYRTLVRYVDAVVIGEGEQIIRALVKNDVTEWRNIPGLHLPNPLGGLRSTGEGERIVLDDFPSPYQLGTAPARHIGYVETFRGCPMSCAFCQWGDARPDRVHGAEYLTSHLRGLVAANVTEIMFLDAGLNLSPRALRNLMVAEREVGALRDIHFHGHLYPTHMDKLFLELLDRTRRPARMAIGIQSFDPDVLRTVDRPFNYDRFLGVLRDLHSRIPIDLEIIMGLPGDTPSAFRKTIETAISVADSVRVFWPLVLPDALLERSEEFGLEFDHESFRLIRSHGWTNAQLIGEWEHTIAIAKTMPRHVQNDTMTSFTTPNGRVLMQPRTLSSASVESLRLAARRSGWLLEDARYSERSGLRFVFGRDDGKVDLEVDHGHAGEHSFVLRDGVAYSHHGDLAHELAAPVRTLIDTIHDATKVLLAS